MSIYTPKAELFYQDGSTPKHYCVVASFKEIEVYGFITVSDVQSHQEVQKTEAYCLSDIGSYYKHQELYNIAQKYFKKRSQILFPLIMKTVHYVSHVKGAKNLRHSI